ncbi:hypothetical protein C2I36_04745 [Rhodobacteraceae bacterium WD3A24]|nr:hypothetical protein C2I36_04745 [Rhodobacteraceae bacterium WD3A24]
MFSRFKSFAAAAALVALGGAAASAQGYSIEGAGSASLTGIVPQTLAQYASDEGIDLQVVLGQTLTRSALRVAAGRLDFAVVPPPAYGAMSRGVGPYAQQAEQAQELSQNMRALFGFPGGTFHAIVWADSGIESWEDVEGRRIYVGPPAGAANAQMRGMVRLATGGYEAGEDYEGMRAPWNAAQQAFQDGQYDVYIAAAAVGQQSLNELSLLRPIRILGMPEDVLGSQEYADFLVDSALTTAEIPAGTYEGQVNSDETLHTPVTTMMIATNADMSEDVAYRLTRAYWENIDEMKANNALLRTIDESRPFIGVNAPLHPGSLRYYREAGVEVPERLIPEGAE